MYIFMYVYINIYIYHISYVYIYIEYLWVIIPKNPLTLVAFLVGRVFATKGAAFGRPCHGTTGDLRGAAWRRTDRIHGTGVSTHICHTFKRNVGI